MIGALSGQLMIAAASSPAYLRFRRALANPERAQRAALSRILSGCAETEQGRRLGLSANDAWTWERFAERTPITPFGDIEPLITRQRQGSHGLICADCDRYQPTSGSGAAIKWIPYSRAFLRELDEAAGAWMFDMSARFPGILRGRHYWSLSWLPNDLRRQTTSDDSELFPLHKRALFRLTMAAPASIAAAEDSEAAWFATACSLVAARDLSFISVWSPTFGLRLLDEIENNRERIARALRDGRWPSELAMRLASVPCPRAPAIPGSGEAWPNLALISAWESATSARPADALKKALPRARFQGKGLWATEGVVSIPFQGKRPLAINSHFLEFRCLTTEKILPAWKLELGQRVQPLLTTGSGLLRYPLDDALEVTDFLERTPCVEFRYRLGGVDLVGEKLSQETASALLTWLADATGREVICLAAIARARVPYYAVLAEGEGECRELAELTEKGLCESFHYRLAREHGQLGPARALARAGAFRFYLRHFAGSVAIEGNIKVEPLVRVDTADFPLAMGMPD